MTAHWLSNEFSQHRAVLRIMHFPECHTGKNISEYLHKGLVSFEISHTKIHIVLRDNAVNMVAGVKDLKDILACCRRLATHFHHSQKLAAAKLEAIQEQLGTNKHRLIQDITTRWNSSYDMIERILDQKVPLATYTADHPTQSTLNTFQWGLLDKVLHILEPFKTLTINFSKRESYLSDVIPSIMALKECFNQALVCEAFLTINTLVEHLSGSVDKRYKLTYQKEDKDKTKNWINEQMQEMQQSNLDFDEPSVHNTNEVIAKLAYPKFNKCFQKVSKLITIDLLFSVFTILECDSNIVNTENSKRLKRSNFSIQMINKEIEEYLKLPHVTEKESLLLWWKNCGNSFKNLKKIT
ncbi:zinc finger BED domain-containing protein 4-like isoform X1 [Hydra vulgaris]|uniref:zinc finger BED domain-containing protein 4-like isoform X1 n=1 Tax=Hydra vulgaris TaxID=6087 RepID=UPI001F5FEEE2|nr:zinc finger BED domain-containing protein 4-like [Hydra vulgaris]